MDWWLVTLLLGGGILLGLRSWLGPADEALPSLDAEEEPWLGEPEPWEADALARYETETSVDQLIAEGRADELRGLGYEGELPEG